MKKQDKIYIAGHTGLIGSAALRRFGGDEKYTVLTATHRELELQDSRAVELFFESNGEVWVVWDRMRTIVPTWRSAFKNPHLFSNIEDTCKRLESWRERRAPGSSERIAR